MTLSNDAREWLEAQQHETAYFDKHAASEIQQEQMGMESIDIVGDHSGYYSRLEQSDWIGPYTTEGEALEALYESQWD